MLKQLWHKIKEALISVLPVTGIVLILNWLPFVNISLTTKECLIFIVSALILIVGIGLFNLGADIAMQPMGEKVGTGLMKTKKISIIAVIALIMGLLITIAEPDLTVLADQVSAVISKNALIYSIGAGVGIFLVIAILKIITKKDLSSIIIYFYFMLFALAALLIALGKGSMFALSFDSGGVTTGPITVPFIMALGVGVAATVGGRNQKENSFGLIALCSVGPIIAVLILSMMSKGNFNYNPQPTDYVINVSVSHVFEVIGHTCFGVVKALGLIFVVFLIIQKIFIKLPKKQLIKIFIGILYTFVGLVIFLSAVELGFVSIGYKLGYQLAQNKVLLIIFAFVLGMVVVLAEPAVHVLTKQVEEVTTGGISKRQMLIALSIGVGISICLSVVRIIFGFSLLWYVIPGYFVSLGLSFFVPKVYTAIAFDSGGVASGPLTSSFILPFAIGACFTSGTSALECGYGVVAMVAMTPLITIQLLGFKDIITKRVRVIRRTKMINDADDDQIINFM